jgi:hypothetical protein
MVLWRDSRAHWEEHHDTDPMAGAYDAALAKSLDEIIAAISARIRVPRWRQRWGARKEAERLKRASRLPQTMTLAANGHRWSRAIACHGPEGPSDLW